jgi:dihydroorotate dehydrogenase (fumarate)
MDLTTRYLGLTLPHPFMPGASPLTEDLDMVSRLEDAGAAAIVMHSLFEEEILGYTLKPDEYLEQLLRIKQRVHVPVIASLNGTNSEGWLQYARLLEQAGADALELNFYHVATDMFEDAASVERRLVDIVAVLKESITLPLAVKLSPFYSALPHLASQLDRMGADGLVLFNRFYQPDINPKSRETVMRIHLSDSSDLLLRLRWIAILWNQVNASLALTGGVHGPMDAVKAVMAGAGAVQLVSALMRDGPGCLTAIRREVARWGDANGYDSIDDLRGRMSLAGHQNGDVERSHYKRILQSWHVPGSPVGGH